MTGRPPTMRHVPAGRRVRASAAARRKWRRRATGPSIDAVVKWFKSDKGFGFVELGNGSGDAFLHIGALQAAGYETVPPGAKLKVNVSNGMKGAQVTRVLEVDTAGASERAPQPRVFGDSPRPARRAPDPSTAVEVTRHGEMVRRQQGFRLRSVE